MEKEINDNSITFKLIEVEDEEKDYSEVRLSEGNRRRFKKKDPRSSSEKLLWRKPKWNG